MENWNQVRSRLHHYIEKLEYISFYRWGDISFIHTQESFNSFLRFTCEHKQQLVHMKGNNEIVDYVMNECKEGGEWSVDIEDYKCLGM